MPLTNPGMYQKYSMNDTSSRSPAKGGIGPAGERRDKYTSNDTSGRNPSKGAKASTGPKVRAMKPLGGRGDGSGKFRPNRGY